MNYTTKIAVQNYLKRNIDTGFDAQLNAYIAAMSRFADTFCSQTLVAETATARKYDGNGLQELHIDDVYDVTEVTANDVVISPLLYPANSPKKHRLLLTTTAFPHGFQNIEVTGKFGRFTSLPPDLEFAVTVLVAGIVNQVDKQTEGIKSEKIGEYQVTYTDGQRHDYEQAMAILKSYRPIIF